MQFNVVFIATALLISAAPALSVGITFFEGAGCTGGVIFSGNFPDNECVSLGGNSAKSVGYSGVPSVINFFESGGAHDSCTNGAQLTLGGGSGCGTASAG